MISFASITNKFAVSLISFVIIILIGFLDWYTGYELTLSIFYLIPVSLLAFYKNTTIPQLVINSFLAALAWFIADIYTSHPYTSLFFPLWETFARLVIFLSISILIYYLKKEHLKLIDSNKKLQALNVEKNQLLGMAAHDLRNPIAVVVSISNLLLNNKDYTEEDVKRLIERINQAGNNTIKLLNDLLDVSRIEAGTVNLKIRKVEYISFIKNCLQENQYLADKKRIKLMFETDIDPLVVEFDLTYMEEVINNLVSNAIKYSFEKSEVNIKITSNESELLTEITDKGVGIPENEVNKLFTPFQKSSARPTSGESSTGLGLAIVKKIVTLHNGSVGITSVWNEGTTAYFHLPLNQYKLKNSKS